MRRVLSTVLAVALLLGLGALAVLALPNANASLAGAPAVSAAAPEFEPDAPAAINKFNHIAMPLNAANQFTSAGYQFNADGLASLVGAGAKQVMQWDAATQQYFVRSIDPELGNSGALFNLAVGGSYWLTLDSTATTIVSFVGDVPAANSVKVTTTRGAPCKYNQFSIPLEQSNLTNADALGASLTATQVLHWDAAGQQWEVRSIDPDLGNSGPNFAVKIGYPYAACLTTAAPVQWP